MEIDTGPSPYGSVGAWVRTLLAVGALCTAATASAAHIGVQVDGVDGPLKAAVIAGLEAAQYGQREVTTAQAQRLYGRAQTQARTALEPYGYYDVQAQGELRETKGDWLIVLHVTPGEPVRVRTIDIRIDGDADGQRPVQKALDAFAPAKGQPLDHAAYEKSKAAIQAAIAASGYLDVKLLTHRIEVTRAAKTADIHLAWAVGQRYRIGATTFEGGQFPDKLLQRYIPWHEGDFYTQAQLLTFQQRLIDADYFSIAQVQPDIEHAHGDTVPIKVLLAPAKRTVYTGGVFIGTDTGPGVRGGIERRWVNQLGHKVKVDALLATQLKTLGAQYQIPLSGADNHNLAFGATYRDENTDTSRSRTFGLAATDSRLWHGWTRTLGLKFLTGDFTVANIQGSTTLLYPEVSLSRKQADDPNFVRRGWSLTASARASPGGPLSDTSFAQVSGDAKWIRGLTERSRLVTRGSFGATAAGNFDMLPPELRYFGGGDQSIRGYAYQTIGPPLSPSLVPQAEAYCAARPSFNCQALIVGGKNLLVASATYEYYFTQNWGMAVFLDTGDAFDTLRDYREKFGTGFGVRWRSPVGMVRVDLGFPVHDSQARHSVELHIVIGPDL